MDKDAAINLLKALIFQVLLFGVVFGAAEFSFRIYSDSLFNAPSSIQNKNYNNTNELMVPNPIPYSGFILLHHLDVQLLGKKLTSNEQGYRTPSFTKEKTSNTVRIIGIGDSVMMGQGVADDEVYLRLLEKRLSKCSKRPVEVINLAIAGQSAEQEYYLLKEMIHLNPDHVVFGYVGNDWFNEEKKQTRDYFSSGSYALNFIILHTLKALGNLKNKDGSPIEPIEWRPFKRQSMPPSISLSRAYQEMSKLLQNREIPGIVVMDSRYEAPMKGHEEMEGFFIRMGLKPINLLKMWHPLPPGLSGTEAVTRDDEHNKLYIIPGDYHPNAIWHRDVAETLFQELSSRYCP